MSGFMFIMNEIIGRGLGSGRFFLSKQVVAKIKAFLAAKTFGSADPDAYQESASTTFLLFCSYPRFFPRSTFSSEAPSVRLEVEFQASLGDLYW